MALPKEGSYRTFITIAPPSLGRVMPSMNSCLLYTLKAQEQLSRAVVSLKSTVIDPGSVCGYNWFPILISFPLTPLF